jgi:hypothetical protein
MMNTDVVQDMLKDKECSKLVRIHFEIIVGDVMSVVIGAWSKSIQSEGKSSSGADTADCKSFPIEILQSKRPLPISIYSSVGGGGVQPHLINAASHFASLFYPDSSQKEVEMIAYGMMTAVLHTLWMLERYFVATMTLAEGNWPVVLHDAFTNAVLETLQQLKIEWNFSHSKQQKIAQKMMNTDVVQDVLKYKECSQLLLKCFECIVMDVMLVVLNTKFNINSDQIFPGTADTAEGV